MAEQEYQAALALDPEHSRTYFRLALLYQAMERWDDALAALDRLVELDPGHRNGLYQIGRTAALSGQGLDRGIKSLSTYLEGTPGPDEPSLAWAHYRLGLVYEHEGDTARARQEYQEALTADPKHQQAKKALKKLS